MSDVNPVKDHKVAARVFAGVLIVPFVIAVLAIGAVFYQSSHDPVTIAGEQIRASLTPEQLKVLDKRNESISQPMAAVITDAEKSICDSLKDCESARFRNEVIKTIHNGQTTVVCGEVNAKNSFGGYTGFQKFMYIPEINASTYIKVIDSDCS
jgi:hypothetical protein